MRHGWSSRVCTGTTRKNKRPPIFAIKITPKIHRKRTDNDGNSPWNHSEIHSVAHPKI